MSNTNYTQLVNHTSDSRSDVLFCQSSEQVTKDNAKFVTYMGYYTGTFPRTVNCSVEGY